MIILSGVLVVVAIALLVAGIVAGNGDSAQVFGLDALVVIYISIAVSIISALCLAIGVFLRRKEIFPGAAAAPAPVDPDAGPPDFDRQFTESWRRELMDQAWASLSRYQERAGQPLHTVLQLRSRHPDLKSPELAERLSEVLGKPVSAGGAREILSRAREVFVNALIEGVRASLAIPTRELIVEELADLRLLDYCRPALRRRGLIK